MQLCFNPNFDSKNRFSTLKHSFLEKISKLNHFNIDFFLNSNHILRKLCPKTFPSRFYGNCAFKNKLFPNYTIINWCGDLNKRLN